MTETDFIAVINDLIAKMDPNTVNTRDMAYMRGVLDGATMFANDRSSQAKIIEHTKHIDSIKGYWNNK